MVRRVALVASGAEGEAALAWLETLPGVTVVSHRDFAAVDLEHADLVWVHGEYHASRTLIPWLQEGGRVLASLDAAIIASGLGIESHPPDERREGHWRHAADEFHLDQFKSFKAFPHIRGLAAFGPHPLFEGLDQGTYVWAPSEGEEFIERAYVASRPATGAVVAVERSFIHLNAERVVAWEHQVGGGGILSLGAFIYLTAPDELLARQLRAMLANAITGDAIPHRDRPVPVSTWPIPERFDPTRGAQPTRVPRVPDLDGPWIPSRSPLSIESPATDDDPWTLAGRRMLLIGGERSGLHEAWSHPVRIACDVRLTFAGGEPEVAGVRVAPDEIVRTIRVGPHTVTERWSTALELPVLIWDLEADSEVPIQLDWVTDFRRMWPYPPGVYGDLGFDIEPGTHRAWLGAAFGSVQLVVSVIGGALRSVSDESRLESPAFRFTCAGAGRLRVVLIAATDSVDLERTLRSLERKRLPGVREQRIQQAAQLREHGTAIECPDLTLMQAFEWAKVRVDSFIGETPGVGRSLLAGYAASRPGWGDGRPGYGWYFGRDACWTAYAQLAAGDREGPRDVLKFLSRNQDVTGKVLHEYTTSGLVHYDAADSTPLYLLLAGRYAAWTGDLEYLARHWDSVERAYHFCLETDTDGDGLIENHRVGHGWIEHGPLGGAFVTLYLAACWVAALEAVEPVAEALGHAALATEIRRHADRARETVARRFRSDGEYALGLYEDGTPQRHRTAMLAVPILLGLVPPDEVQGWFDAVAGEGFTAPWGVRMIPRDDPLFDPAGYHLGAVWPLYTGWASLAEWRGGRPKAALIHLRANAGLVRERAKGAFDEVMHGTEHRAAGVCPDQAWSAAMVLSPTIEGLWGVVPDALEGAVRLAPHFPEEWDAMALKRLRVGRTTLDISVRRRPGRVVANLVRSAGPRVHVTLSLAGIGAPSAIELDELAIAGERVAFDAEGRHEIVYHE